MFGRQKRLKEAVRNEVREALHEALKELGTNQQSTNTQALAGALEGFLSKALETQAKNLEAMGNFMSSVGDLTVRRAAAALGSRGGRTRAANAARAKAAGRASDDCAVCIDPNSHDQAAILRHVNEGHDARRAAQHQADREAHEKYVRGLN
jgi:hypothetical protein